MLNLRLEMGGSGYVLRGKSGGGGDIEEGGREIDDASSQGRTFSRAGD